MFFACDTSALVALSAIGRLDLLRWRCQEVWLPPEVVRELITNGDGWVDAAQAQSEFAKAEWIFSWTQSITLQNATSQRLGLGEVEAVSLAFQQRGMCFIDDQQGRAFAESMGVEIMGALGVVRSAKLAGIIPAVKPLLLEMKAKGTHYSFDLITQSLADLGE